MEDFIAISKKIKENAKDNEVNTIQPFVEAPSNRKLSIIGVYDNAETSIVNGAGEVVPFIASEYYYGLSPVFGADEVCLALKRGVFKDGVSLEKFIGENADIFKLPASMGKYARPLFAKTLVKMSTMFGYNLTCQNEECYKRFCVVAKDIAEINLDYDINEKNRNVRFLGQPDETFLQVLDDNFSINEQGQLTLKKQHSTQSFSQKLYGCRIELVRGKGYYSGVLPRVKSFEWHNLDYFNAEVTSLTIKFGRTTFATRDAFDNSYIKNHRLLKDYKSLIEETDKFEDLLLQEYLSDLTGTNDEVMQKINIFLSKSYSTHHLSVSGNVVTSDGYLILGKRGAKTIDSGGYYCSINGQSEIYDTNVKFYSQSVYEDMPTININDGKRIDFLKEFEREAEAELNILCLSGHWSLRGVSFLAIMNKDDSANTQRRFHFNILGECITEHPLEHIIKMQKSATEKFENSNLIGVKITKYKNAFSRIASSVKNSLMLILKSRDFITSVFALALFVLSFKELKNAEFTVKSLSSIVSIIFTALSLIVLVNSIIMAIISYSKRKSTHYKLSITGDCVDYYSSIHNTLKHKNIKLHPIADLLMYEYIKFL